MLIGPMQSSERVGNIENLSNKGLEAAEGTTLSFLKAFIAQPQQIGALVPSSRYLARRIADSVDWNTVQVVIECGPGSGAVTGALLHRMGSKRDFFAVELNQQCAAAFKQNYPDVPLYRASAAELVEICALHGVKQVDCLVSGLPWANFSNKEQEHLLEICLRVLSPDGQLITFGYPHGLFLSSGKRFRRLLDSRFRKVIKSQLVWRNTPPAFVYHCRR